MKSKFLRVFPQVILILALGAYIVWPATVQADPTNDVESAFRAHRQKDYDTAIKLYTKTLNDRNLNNRERAVTYLLRGEVYRDQGNPDRAIADFDRAIRLKSNYAQAYYYRGLTFAKKGQAQKALKDVEKAAMLEPDNNVYRHRLNMLQAKLAAQTGSDPSGKDAGNPLAFGPETEKTP